MGIEVERQVAAVMQRQLGLVSTRQALELGMTEGQISGRRRTGAWETVFRGVHRCTAAPATAEQEHLAACMAAGSRTMAGGLSAAWLWDLVPRPPGRPVLLVPAGTSARLGGTEVHRTLRPGDARPVNRKGVPACDVPRLLTDLAPDLSADDLDALLDRAIARRLTSVPTLTREARRRRNKGRRGPSALVRALYRRHLIGAPDPSVLEALTRRLFARYGIPVLRSEVRWGADGCYRIDFLIAPGLAVEVDGYAYHWSPEAKARDEARRNRLRLEGLFLLVYTWPDITADQARVVAEVRAATLARAA